MLDRQPGGRVGARKIHRRVPRQPDARHQVEDQGHQAAGSKEPERAEQRRGHRPHGAAAAKPAGRARRRRARAAAGRRSEGAPTRQSDAPRRVTGARDPARSPFAAAIDACIALPCRHAVLPRHPFALFLILAADARRRRLSRGGPGQGQVRSRSGQPGVQGRQLAAVLRHEEERMAAVLAQAVLRSRRVRKDLKRHRHLLRRSRLPARQGRVVRRRAQRQEGCGRDPHRRRGGRADAGRVGSRSRDSSRSTPRRRSSCARRCRSRRASRATGQQVRHEQGFLRQDAARERRSRTRTADIVEEAGSADGKVKLTVRAEPGPQTVFGPVTIVGESVGRARA